MIGRRTTKKTSTTVFVDDYVLGRLPGVCTLSGVACCSTVRVTRKIDGPSAAWLLLIFLGPVGWIGLAMVALSGRRSALTGEIPISRAEYERFRHDKRASALVSLAAVIVLVGSLFLDPAFAGGVAVASTIGFFYGLVRYQVVKFRWPAADLDASRRWVTISGVHPEFAAACADQRAARSADVAQLDRTVPVTYKVFLTVTLAGTLLAGTMLGVIFEGTHSPGRSGFFLGVGAWITLVGVSFLRSD